MNRSKLIACATIIEEALPFLPGGMAYHTIDAQLHNHPDKLHHELQRVISDTDSQYDQKYNQIIIGYGLCSKAVIGLISQTCSLVAPLVDDCIGLFLGSQTRYRELMKTNLGTYYLSPGWIKAGATLIEELDRVEERYGKKNAEIVKEEMLKNYKQLVFINMGNKNEDVFKTFAKKASVRLNLTYDEIHGTTKTIKKMLMGPWDDQFVVTTPGRKITYEDFGLNKFGLPCGS